MITFASLWVKIHQKASSLHAKDLPVLWPDLQETRLYFAHKFKNSLCFDQCSTPKTCLQKKLISFLDCSKKRLID